LTDVARRLADRPIFTRVEQATSVPHVGVSATRMGLRWPDRLVAFDQWQEIGARMARTTDSVAWCLGDWLVYGESRYADRYRRTIDTVGLKYQTLRNYAWVARRFPLSRRRDSLTLYHHMEVTRLPVVQQDRWLDRAVDGRWSVHRLRERLRQERGDERGVTTDIGTQPKIDVAQRRLDRWQAAADHADDTLEHWVVASLDLAADQALGGEHRSVQPSSR
jgi:hypothetical protein